jgi:hypothetical protein
MNLQDPVRRRYSDDNHAERGRPALEHETAAMNEGFCISSSIEADIRTSRTAAAAAVLPVHVDDIGLDDCVTSICNGLQPRACRAIDIRRRYPKDATIEPWHTVTEASAASGHSMLPPVEVFQNTAASVRASPKRREHHLRRPLGVLAGIVLPVLEPVMHFWIAAAACALTDAVLGGNAAIQKCITGSLAHGLAASLDPQDPTAPNAIVKPPLTERDGTMRK